MILTRIDDGRGFAGSGLCGSELKAFGIREFRIVV